MKVARTGGNEAEQLCEALVSTFQYWDDKIPKDKHREQLQACFRLALELGILIGTNRRFAAQEMKEIRRMDGEH